MIGKGTAKGRKGNFGSVTAINGSEHSLPSSQEFPPQKRIKYICPCCKEIDTILFCCECLRKQKEKTKKQACDDTIKEIIINMEISLSMSYCKNKEQKMMKKAQWETIKCFKSLIKQLEKEGKK